MSAPPPAASAADAAEKERVLALRRRHIGFNVSLHFARTPRGPLLIDRGEGAWLIEQGSGRRFLDCVNNVAHLGHSHAGFVRACAAQSQLLNTNSRYLHAGIADYSRRLCATFPKPAEGEGATAAGPGPGPLEVVFWVNSGSEANDLALRLARAHTGRRGIMCVETAYHGHTGELIGISPYKHDRPGGAGRPAWVRAAACPDALSGRVRGAIDDDAVGAAYAADVDKQLASFAADARAEAACVAARDRRRAQAAASAAGAAASASAEDAEAQAAQAFMDAQLMPDGLSAGCAAFIMESILSCGGQVLPPAGYLRRVYASVRAAGAVCIADEVQVGFGRVGSHFWAFERQGADVRPDIVTLGKPMGNVRGDALRRIRARARARATQATAAAVAAEESPLLHCTRPRPALPAPAPSPFPSPARAQRPPSLPPARVVLRAFPSPPW